MKVKSKTEIRHYEVGKQQVEEVRAQIEENLQKEIKDFEERQASVREHLAKLDTDFARAEPAVYEVDEITEEEGREVKTSFGRVHAEKGSFILRSGETEIIATAEDLANDFEEA
jgi:hypothetical protein